MEDILKDDRFAHVVKDPRFRKVPLRERKVKIDNRFKHMFKDKRFKMKYTVDKRGRPVNLTTNENLKKYYELSDEDSSDANEDDVEQDIDEPEEVPKSKQKKKDKEKQKKLDKGKQKKVSEAAAKKKQETEVVNDSDDNEESEEESEEEFQTNDSGVDLARGVGNAYSSSSSDDDSSDDDDDDEGKTTEDFDHGWGERDKNVVEMEEATCRLAVCNMDWDRVKARDIYMLLNSFKPTKGLIKSVKVYPSEFGKERMAEEEKQGPKELTEVKIEGEGEEEEGRTEDDEGTSYHMEKLREYQLKRLRYYYGVVECDTRETADSIYKDCDGLEYESSCTTLDLRFIPEEMEFEESEDISSCTEAPANYKPLFFNNAALSQSKVDLTWDETDRDRVQLTSEQFSKSVDEIEEENLKAYLASSSDEEASDYAAVAGAAADDDDEDDAGDSGSEDEDKRINKYKALLQDIDRQQEKGKGDVQMEITWEPGLKETTETIVKKKKKNKDSTVWEEYLEKRKEKKKKKIEERKMKKKMREEEEEEDDMDNRDDDRVENKEPVEGELAFSDDEVPDGIDPFMMDRDDSEKKGKKKQDKKKNKGLKHQATADTDDPQKAAELSLLMMGEEEEGRKHFNFNDLVEEEGQKKKKKKKKEKLKGTGKKDIEEDFQVNVADPRFSAVYESHLFNIDPSAPEFRKTKGTELMITEKLKRNKDPKGNKRGKSDNNSDKSSNVKKVKLNEPEKMAIKDDSLASLVKSVKAKTKHFQTNKVKR